VTVDMVKKAWEKALATNNTSGADARKGMPLTDEEATGLLQSCSPAALQRFLQPSETNSVPMDMFLKAVLHTEGRENASLEVISSFNVV
jgi:hypothetical protein